jgi:allantoin racemase
MKIWHQSFTVLEDLPAYRDAMAAHVRKVVRPDTEVEMHGQLPGTYPSNYPGTDLSFLALGSLHSLQWILRAVEAERSGFDAYAMATIPNPLIREIRTIVDIPVVGYGEASYHVASMLGRRFGVLVFIDRMAPLLEDHRRPPVRPLFPAGAGRLYDTGPRHRAIPGKRAQSYP